jgi:hypothetical protein
MATVKPSEIVTGDRLVLDDKTTVRADSDAYVLGENRIAVDTKLGMIQMDGDQEVRIQRAI